VPVYFSRRTDILQKPVPALILSALAILTENYSYDAVFRYLKTGLTGIFPEETDLRENYVLKWYIRGSSWTREQDWTMHPRGYNSPGEAEEGNFWPGERLRETVCAPLRRLHKSGAETARGHATALYRLSGGNLASGTAERGTERFSAEGGIS
jgi:ATP-dependent helicase/nuclease subunit B